MKRPPISAAVKLRVYQRDGGKCQYCGCSVPLEKVPMIGWAGDHKRFLWVIDHKTPVARGGTNDPANLALSCLACNQGKGQMTADEFNAARTK